jgi:UDP-3-O-[3-hydroxymyristoyl] glucosamine N-acyltransferase
MLLSDLPSTLKLKIIRNGRFENLGFFADDLPQKLIFIEGPKFVKAAQRANGAACILAAPDVSAMVAEAQGLAVSLQPRLDFWGIQRFLALATTFYGPSFPTVIDPSATVHPRAWISETNVTVGPAAEIGPNVMIHGGTSIGARVRIQAGAIIGAEGFQTVRTDDRLVQMVHAGGVAIHDDVEIFANAVVARAVFRQQTTLGRFSRIGNGAFVSHNVQIGSRSFVGHNAAVNGNTVIGDDVWIGPNATIANLLDIGSGASVSLGSVVIESVAPGARVSGPFAIDHAQSLRRAVAIR